MKFVMSFSTGKDSMLALHRMVKAGHEPVSLLVMFNKDAERSWFHGADGALLAAISDALDIPLIRCVTTGDEYIQSMERSRHHKGRDGNHRAYELCTSLAWMGCEHERFSSCRDGSCHP